MNETQWNIQLLYAHFCRHILYTSYQKNLLYFQCPSLHLVHVETIGDDQSLGVAARRNTMKVSLERYRQVCTFITYPLVCFIHRMHTIIMHLFDNDSEGVLKMN